MFRLLKCAIVGIFAIVSFSVTAQIVNSAANTITLVVPQAPGGGTDIPARILAEAVTKNGITVIVENRPGGERSIGANYVATSVPNGRTLFFGSLSDTVMLPLFKYPNLKFNEKTLIPISYVGSQPFVLTASPDFPANNFKEFLEVIKKDPGRYPIGSFGKTSNLNAYILFDLVGAVPTIINYKGDAPLLVDLAGGSLPIGTNSYAGSRQLAKEKKIKYIAIMSNKREKDFPNVGTTAEYNRFTSYFWNGVYAPEGTDNETVAYLHKLFNQALGDPAVIEKLKAHGYNTKLMSQKQFAQFYQSESDYYRPIVDKFLPREVNQ
jgi:tripartite-type tricarboxylate transporter receptor subunit TctC